MTASDPESRTCAHNGVASLGSSDKSLRTVAVVAHRLHALLEAADILTEKAELTELDLVALDVLLIAGREHASAIIKQIEDLSGADGDASVGLRQ